MQRTKRQRFIERKQNAFSRSYDRQIRIAERKNFKTARGIYQKGFDNATDLFLLNGNLEQVERMPAEILFEFALFNELFNQIYLDTGLQFATWYERNFERFIKKQDPFIDPWTEAFTAFGARQAGQRVVSIQGTAKKVFLANIRRQFTDPEFAALSIQEKANILKKAGYWKKDVNFMARRVARTESNAAANFGLQKSAESLFPNTRLLKRWITAGDEKVRPTHVQAGNGQAIPMNTFFNVGGVQMRRPSDPEAIGPPKAVASEVINCRCRLEVFPDPNAIEDQLTGEFDLLFPFALGLLSSQEEELVS